MDRIAEALGVLGLGTNATREDIAEAYRKLVKKYHPDRFMHDDRLRKASEQRLKSVNKAYEFLQRHNPTSTADTTYENRAEPTKSTSTTVVANNSVAKAKDTKREKVRARGVDNNLPKFKHTTVSVFGRVC